MGTWYRVNGTVGFDGREWIVAYTSPGGVALRRMSRDGVLSAETIVADVAGISIRVASPGDGHFAIVWETTDPPGDPNAGTIRASIDGGAPIVVATGVKSYPDVAWDGRVFRIVWMNYEWVWSTPPGHIHQYTTPVGVTFASLNMNGEVVIDDRVSSRSSSRPRVAGGLGMFVGVQGAVVRRDGFDVGLNIFSSWYPDPPGFAADGAGNAVIALGSTELLLDSDDRQSFLSVPGAADADVVYTNNGWVMVYTRVVDDPPYMHAPRVFIRPLDFTPAKTRAFRF